MYSFFIPKWGPPRPVLLVLPACLPALLLALRLVPLLALVFL